MELDTFASVVTLFYYISMGCFLYFFFTTLYFYNILVFCLDCNFTTVPTWNCHSSPSLSLLRNELPRLDV